MHGKCVSKDIMLGIHLFAASKKCRKSSLDKWHQMLADLAEDVSNQIYTPVRTLTTGILSKAMT